MNVTCPNCATIYRVDPAKVPEGGVRARCSVCSAVFAVKREGEEMQPPRPPAKEPVAATVPKPAPVAESPKVAPPSVTPRPAAPAAAGPAGSPPRPAAPQKPPAPAAGFSTSPAVHTSGTAPGTADAGASSYQSSRPRTRQRRRPHQPLPLRLVRPRRLKRRRRPAAPKPATPVRRSNSSFSASAAGSGPVRCPAAESISFPGPGTQGEAPGPGADLRYGRLPSGQAAGGTARRKSQGTVRGGDQEELGGVRGTGRARDCRLHRLFPGGAERDPGGWDGKFSKDELPPIRFQRYPLGRDLHV